MFSNYNIQSLGSGYKLFTITKGIGHFSLEYPERYEIGIVEFGNDSQGKYSHASFRWDPPKEEQMSKASSDIDIEVYEKTATLTDGQSSLEVALRLSANTKKDYKLIEYFNVTVAGEQSYGAVYSWTRLPGVPNAPLKPVITREIDFVHDDLIWMVEMTSDSSTADIDKADFDHMLQTFKIFN